MPWECNQCGDENRMKDRCLRISRHGIGEIGDWSEVVQVVWLDACGKIRLRQGSIQQESVGFSGLFGWQMSKFPILISASCDWRAICVTDFSRPLNKRPLN